MTHHPHPRVVTSRFWMFAGGGDRSQQIWHFHGQNGYLPAPPWEMAQKLEKQECMLGQLGFWPGKQRLGTP